MITKQYFEFFNDLASNNSRDWFLAQKPRYEAHVKQPFYEFVERVIDEIRMYEPDITQTAKDAVFRLHRDTRFSKDKTPYKTQLGAAISKEGKKAMGYPGFYFELGAGGCWFGGGSYMPDKDKVETIREVIADHADEFMTLMRSKPFATLYGDIKGEKNKVLPKEIRDVVATVPLIANKQWYWMVQVPNSKVVGEKGVVTAMEYYRAARPLQEFLLRAF